MSADRVRILREGYVDVKAPPDSPERILHKAWRRLWVVAASYTPSGRGSDPQLVLQLHRHPRPPEGTPPPMKRLRCPRDGLRIFRCRSSSRPLRTFGLASGSDLLLYLAAETEDRSQAWMDDLREGLWPGFTPPATGVWWDVSLLDDEDSAGCGLLGAYGRLGLTTEDSLCLLHPHWQATQMRWGTADLLAVLPVRNTVDAEGVFKLTVKCNKKGGRVFQFYSKNVSETIEWIQSIIDPNFNPKSSKEDSKPVDSILTESTVAIKETKAAQEDAAQENEYGKVNPQLKAQDNIKQEEAGNLNEGMPTDSPSKNPTTNKPTQDPQKAVEAPSEKGHKTHRRLPSLPGHLLDASMCSYLRGGGSGPASAEVSDEEDDSSFDHIYEDMGEGRSERSDTVYEEIDDGPEMPPVMPAIPDPATLRLQKLSESLSEALKIAEQAKEEPKIVRRKSSKKAERPKKILAKELPLRPSAEGKRSPPQVLVNGLRENAKKDTSIDLMPKGAEASSKVPVKEETEAKYTDMR